MHTNTIKGDFMSDSYKQKKQNGVTGAEQLVNELLDILASEVMSDITKLALLQKLVIYISNRDGQVLAHGYKVGTQNVTRFDTDNSNRNHTVS